MKIDLIAQKSISLLRRMGIFLMQGLYVQLFMTIVSFPILTSWGLPLSVYTLISTLLFTPFLLCFLLVSSLLFVCHLCKIPDEICVWLLEHLSYIWSSLITYHQQNLLVGFRQPPFFIYIILVCATVYTVKKRSITIGTKNIILFFCLGITLIVCKTIFAPKNGTVLVPCNRSNLEIINEQGSITVIDPGVIGSSPSASSWISYDFVSDLTRTVGATCIDHFVLCRINQRTFQALYALASRVHIKNLYLPEWHDSISKKAYRQWRLLADELALQGGKMHRIKSHYTISDSIYLQLSHKTVRYHDAWYHPLVAVSNNTMSIH